MGLRFVCSYPIRAKGAELPHPLWDSKPGKKLDNAVSSSFWHPGNLCNSPLQREGEDTDDPIDICNRPGYPDSMGQSAVEPCLLSVGRVKVGLEV